MGRAFLGIPAVSRFGFPHPRRNFARYLRFEMKPKLGVQFLFHSPRFHQSLEPIHKRACSGRCSMIAASSVSRFQRSVSLFSCARPLAVSF
jgi:hypothetical protein